MITRYLRVPFVAVTLLAASLGGALATGSGTSGTTGGSPTGAGTLGLARPARPRGAWGPSEAPGNPPHHGACRSREHDDPHVVGIRPTGLARGAFAPDVARGGTASMTSSTPRRVTNSTRRSRTERTETGSVTAFAREVGCPITGSQGERTPACTSQHLQRRGPGNPPLAISFACTIGRRRSRVGLGTVRRLPLRAPSRV